MRTRECQPVKSGQDSLLRAPLPPSSSLSLSLSHTLTHHSGGIGHSEGGLLSPSCDVAAVLLYLLQQLAHRLAVIGHFAFLQECFQLQGHGGRGSMRKKELV